MTAKAAGEQLGVATCSACGFERARVKSGNNGTLSISCSECGTSAFVKSPKAVAALLAKIGKRKEAPSSPSNDFAAFVAGA